MAAGVCFWSGGSRFASEFEGKHRECFSEGESKSEEGGVKEQAGVSLPLHLCPASILKFYSHSSSYIVRLLARYIHNGSGIRRTDRQHLYRPFIAHSLSLMPGLRGLLAVAPPPQLWPDRTREIKEVEVHRSPQKGCDSSKIQ